MLKWLYDNESVTGIFTIAWVCLYFITLSWIVPAVPEHYTGWLSFADFSVGMNWIQVMISSLLFIPLVFAMHRITQMWNLLGKISNIDFLIAALAISLISVKPFGFIDIVSVLVTVVVARGAFEILDASRVMVNAYNSGFMIGLISLVFPADLTLISWVVLALAFSSEFKTRALGLLLLGLFTPAYMAMMILMNADVQPMSLFSVWHDLNWLSLDAITAADAILPVIAALLLLAFKASGSISTTLKERRKWMLLQWMFFTSVIFGFLVSPSKIGWLAYLPSVLIISRFMTSSQRSWVKDVVLTALIAVAIGAMFF